MVCVYLFTSFFSLVADPERPDLARRVEHELAFHLATDRVVFVVDPYAYLEAAIIHFELEGSAHIRMVVERVQQHMRIVALVMVVEGILSPSPDRHPIGHVIAGHGVEAAHELRRGVEGREIASAKSPSGERERPFRPEQFGVDPRQATDTGPGVLLPARNEIQLFAYGDDRHFMEVERHRRNAPQHRRIGIEERLVGRRRDDHIHRALLVEDRRGRQVGGKLAELGLDQMPFGRRKALVGKLGQVQVENRPFRHYHHPPFARPDPGQIGLRPQA